MEEKIDIAVLVSGSGTNLQALIDSQEIRPRINVVISDRAGAPALQRAERAEIPTAVVAWEDFDSRARFSEAVADAVEAHGCQIVVLAGFMRILSTDAVDRFSGRILNIHPSLLPAFPGAGAVAQALEHGVKVTGVTVHVVDEHVDHGPIIAQQPVEVLPGDDEASLHHRIQEIEHVIYPEVVRAFIAGEIAFAGRKVVSR